MGETVDLEDATCTENVAEMPITKKIKKKSKIKKKQKIETNDEPIGKDLEEMEKVDLEDATCAVNVIENGISSSPLPLPNKKKIKKKSKVKKINEPLENGKLDSEESPVRDKNEMVLV